MSTELISKDYLTLLKEDIPNGREDLINTSRTLEDVAQHCLNTYDKSLEQTVNYTAQALGSVAYKINLLASNFLEVLDQQNVKLNGLQTKVNHLNMQVQIHNEKTARLSIGKYTLPRDPSAMRPTKIVEPISEVSGKYRRREIDFTALDNVGHGVKDPQLCGSTVMYNTTSRRSSASGPGSETHSSVYAYNQSNPGGTVGSKFGSEYIAKYGKSQTLGRPQGSSLSNATNTVYRSTSGMPAKSHIPMISPSVCTASTVSASVSSPPPQSPNYGTGIHYQQMLQQQQQLQLQQQQQQQQQGTRRSNSISTTSNSSTTSSQPQQQKQYQTPGNMVVLSPQKVAGQPAVGNYGYGGAHPMAHIPPPPPPPATSVTQSEQPMITRYSELPPPPFEPPCTLYQANMTVLPPPPPSLDHQFSNVSNTRTSNNEHSAAEAGAGGRFPVNESVPIAHLQPNPYDSMRHKVPNDPPWVPIHYLCKVVTLYEYQQNKDDELSFQENELIYVVKKNNDGWWEGVMSNRTGLFPGNYVQVVMV